MVGADDHALPGDGPAAQQFVAAVPATVRECPQRAVLTAGEQDTPGAGRFRAQITGGGNLGAAAYAGPAAAEEMLLLPGEHRRIDIGGAGQHPALPERAQGVRQGGRVHRGIRVQRLTDHTVKSRHPLDGCPAGQAALSRDAFPRKRAPAFPRKRASAPLPWAVAGCRR